MAMVGCQYCGKVETLARIDPRRGEVWKPCPECGHPLRGMSLADAVVLHRERASLDLRRGVAGASRKADHRRGGLE